MQPLIKEKAFKNISDEKRGQIQKVNGLVFGPGINRTIAYVPMLKHLNNSKIPYHVIMGTGLGAVFASYAASEISHNKIEWDFFQLVKELKNIKPYSEEWIDIVDEKMLSKFKGIKIESLSKLLLIPLFDTDKKEIVYFYKGDLYLALKYNLYLMSSSKYKYVSALKRSPFKIDSLDRFGVDNWFGFDVLGDSLSFNKVGDDFLIGVLGQVITVREKDKLSYSGFFKLPLSTMPLDSVNNIPKYLKKSDAQAKLITDEIKVYLEK